jgi:two-component system, OmpR family, response regulator RegX3
MDALLFSHHAEEAAVLTLVLQQAGFMVKSMKDLNKALETWPEQPLDLICATLSQDLQKDLNLLRQMRAATVIPIIVIVDPLLEDEEINLLEEGIDLVITRPYSSRMLLARIRALLRRTAGMPFFSLPSLTQGDVVLDPASHTVIVGDSVSTRLTQLEFRLLYSLMIHAGQIIPTESIVEQVWGYSGDGNRDLARGLIQRLRSKIEPDRQSPKYIMTEKGIGYYFNRFDQ